MSAPTKYQTIEESREALVLYIQEKGDIPREGWGILEEEIPKMHVDLLDLAALGYLDLRMKRRGPGDRTFEIVVNAIMPDRNLGTYQTHGVGGGHDAEIIAEIELERGGAHVECPECEGQGEVPGINYVTRDMAIDAGEPDMEGMKQAGFGTCPVCLGDGVVGAED